MVPIFEALVYPCFAKCNLLTPLQRIGAGGILAGVAFIISAIVELQLEVSVHHIKLFCNRSAILSISRHMRKSLPRE